MPELEAVNLDTLDADAYADARRGKAPVTPTEEVETPSEAAEQVAKTVPEPEPGDDGEVEEQPKKSKGGFQKRIDKLTKRIYELEAQVEEGKSGPVKAEKAPDSDMPKMEDFEDLESFTKALVQHGLKLEKQKQAQEEEKAELGEIYSSYNKRVAEFVTEHQDFEDVLDREDVKIPQSVQLAIVDMENGPEVAYFLGTNLDVLEKLNSMRPVRAVVELGKIAAKLESSPKAKPASTASEPIKPVSGSARSARPLSEVDDPDEYIKRRRAEKAANRRN